MPNLHDYHAQEVAALRQAGYAFSKLASATDDCHLRQDPNFNVPLDEQLLKGCAWLTAQIKQQFDTYQLDWQEQMLRYLMPDALQPLPAMTIAHWHDLQHRLSETITVMAGTEVKSTTDSVTKGHVWQTTQPIRLHPLHVSKCHYQEKDPYHAVIELEFTLNPQATLERFTCSEIVFYLNANLHLARQLYYLLLHPKTRVIVCSDKNQKDFFPENPFCAHWVNPEQQNPAYLSSDARQWLRWYFCFPQQFLWVRLTQLSGLFKIKNSRQWQLQIHLPKACALGSHMTNQTFLMHCAPLINLRQQLLDPIRLKPDAIDYPLLPHSRQEELYQVSQVVGYRRQQHEAIEIPLFHCLQSLPEDSMCYRILRKSILEKTPSYALVIEGEKQETLDYVTVTAWSCTNTIIEPFDSLTWRDVAGLAEMFQVKPLVQPSAFQSAIAPTKLLPLLTQCLQHGQFSSDFLCREIQQCAQWLGSNDQKKLASMQVIQLEPFYELCQGVIRQGHALHVELDEHAFVDHAEIFLWGSVFDQFCQSIHPMDRLLVSKWTLFPSQQTLRWRSKDA